MIVEPVNSRNVARFLEYYERNAAEHDNSYRPERGFTPDRENPSLLLLHDDVVIGVASAMLKGFKTIGKARFRILHCVEPNEDHYRMLLEHLIPLVQEVKSVFGFIPEHLTLTRQIWENLGLSIERYAWLLERDKASLTPDNFPVGYELRPVLGGRDEEIYARVLNECFSAELGRYQKTAEDIRQIMHRDDYTHGDMQLLYHYDTPIGVLSVSRGFDDGRPYFWLDTLGLLADYRGRRLGKQLLRAGCQLALNTPYEKILLSVQAQNETAAELYMHEGFTKMRTMVCYSWATAKPV